MLTTHNCQVDKPRRVLIYRVLQPHQWLITTRPAPALLSQQYLPIQRFQTAFLHHPDLH